MESQEYLKECLGTARRAIITAEALNEKIFEALPEGVTGANSPYSVGEETIVAVVGDAYGLLEDAYTITNYVLALLNNDTGIEALDEIGEAVTHAEKEIDFSCKEFSDYLDER